MYGKAPIHLLLAISVVPLLSIFSPQSMSVVILPRRITPRISGFFDGAAVNKVRLHALVRRIFNWCQSFGRHPSLVRRIYKSSDHLAHAKQVTAIPNPTVIGIA